MDLNKKIRDELADKEALLSTKLVCPIRHGGHPSDVGRDGPVCLESRCARFSKVHEQCATTAIATELHHLRDGATGDGINMNVYLPTDTEGILKALVEQLNYPTGS